MNFFPRWLLLGAILAASGPWARGQSAAPPTPVPAWPVTTSPARFTIETGRPDLHTILGWVRMYVPDPKWETMPIRVFTDKGIAVGSDVVWSAPGEPLSLIFDTSSGAKKYHVYFGSNWPPMHVTDKQAGTWIESRDGVDKPIMHADEMLDTWKKAADHVAGRDLTDGLYEGGNRFGPQRNLLVHLQSWFVLEAPAHLDFAPVSCFSSFVYIDGKATVEWPGNHNYNYGPEGPPRAGVDLAAGVHAIDYYNSFVASPGSGWPPLLACLMAKGGPLKDWTMLRPNNLLLRQASPFHVTGYELQQEPTSGPAPSGAPRRAIMVHFENESIINSDEADIGLIAIKFSCLPAVTGTATWTFDDGATADGAEVKHVFPRPGTRTIGVSVQENGKPAEVTTRQFFFHPRWANLTGQIPQLSGEHESAILGRDLNALSASDQAGCFALFAYYKHWDDVLKFIPPLCAKMGEVKDTDLSSIREAALALMRDDHQHSAEEIQLLRAIIDRAAQLPPMPDVATTAARCRLVLARLLLLSTDHTDEVSSLIDAINPSSLVDEEPRSLDILRGDLLLAKGDVAGARKKFADLTGEPTGPDMRSSIRRTARISQARAFLDRKDNPAAYDALREVAWKAPIEKLSADWALTQLRLFQEEDRPREAYLWARRLMPVINGDGRSELLFRLTTLAFAQKDDDLAHKTLSELLKKFPYSPEAAQAKEKWPGSQ